MSTTSSTMGLICPDVNDKKGQTITDLAANFAIIDALYPVGSIYMSTKSTDPSTFIGGTWARLYGGFLYGADNTHAAGTTGGEATHTLTIAEIPAHESAVLVYNADGSSGTDGYVVGYGNGREVSVKQGSGTAHNNMPPYTAVYMWQRTA